MLKGNMNTLLKQAQEVQKQIENVQQELSTLIIDAESGGGMVSIQVNGKLEVIALNIDAEALKEDKEVVEDLIISVTNKAITKAQSESQKKMNAVTGGMLSGLKLPGM